MLAEGEGHEQFVSDGQMQRWSSSQELGKAREITNDGKLLEHTYLPENQMPGPVEVSGITGQNETVITRILNIFKSPPRLNNASLNPDNIREFVPRTTQTAGPEQQAAGDD